MHRPLALASLKLLPRHHGLPRLMALASTKSLNWWDHGKSSTIPYEVVYMVPSCAWRGISFNRDCKHGAMIVPRWSLVLTGLFVRL